ncbi:MAG TPA: ABC transporter permease [bacterium]|nr:ABC transporter permease [bacterium]
MDTFQYVGRTAASSLEDVGAAFLLLIHAMRAVPSAIKEKRLAAEQMLRIGIGSIPLVLVTSIFTGGVAAVQAAYQFQNYIPMRYIGTVIGKSVVIELGPVLTALVIGGRVGASIAAELGTMKVTEQIDALETLAISPINYLVAPRLIAAVIMLPVVTVFADFLAILGGWVVSLVGLGVSTHVFFSGLRIFFHMSDVFSGLVKAVFFGAIIAMMGCFHGLRTEGGAEGVGIATTRAVVSSCLLILITDYILASLLFRAVFMG